MPGKLPTPPKPPSGTTGVMNVIPLLDDPQFDAEISIETTDGKMMVFRKDRRHATWMVETNWETGEMGRITEHQFQVSLGSIWFNYRTMSGLYKQR